MRTRFFIPLAIGCLMVAGCTVDVPEGRPEQPVPIVFQAPVVSTPTKTDAGYANHEMPVGYNTAEKFSVYALESLTAFSTLDASAKSRYYMNDEECVYDSGYNAWKPSGNFYWLPAAAGAFYMNFQAYSPSVAGEDMTISHSWDNGFVFTGFSPRTPGEQYDLLYSDRVTDKQRPDYNPDSGDPYEEDSGDQGTYAGIDLCFHHTLCSIVFNVRAKVPHDAIQQIHLQELKVTGLWNKGTFTQSSGSWGIDGDAAETEYVVYLNTGTAEQGLLLEEDNDNTTDDFVRIQNALMLIPQDLLHPGADPLDPSDDTHVSIEITYTRTIVATGKTVTATETADLVTGNNGNYYQDSTGGTPADIDSWDMGRRYTFNLTLNLYKVLVDPTVKAWNDFSPEHNIDL